MATRKNIMLGTAGHVDHGKTALVRLLTGCETDTLPAEKQRGLTIELGFAPCTLRDQRIVGIVDVPGHVDFIRNMVTGAHGIDVVMLVIAADDGIMPQTREHLDILTLMGVRHGLVALTKIDLVDEELRQLAADEIRQFVANTFLADAPICGISNITGEGFEQFFDALDAAVAACSPRETGGLFRMWIESVFGIRGFGSVVTGIPLSGQVQVGDRLTLLPGGQSGRVRKLEVYGQDAQLGQSGECVAINLADIQPELLGRGKVLCEAGGPEGQAFEAVELAEAQVALLEHVQAPLKDFAEVHLHVGAGDVMARVVMLEGVSLQRAQPRLVQLRLARPMALAAGDRFVIRAGMSGLLGGAVTTIGGGRIIGTSNQKLRRSRPEVLAALARRAAAIDQPSAWAQTLLRESPQPVAPGELARRAQIRLAAVQGHLAELLKSGRAVQTPDGAAVHADRVGQAQDRIVQALTAFHDANPRRLGMEEAELLEQLRRDKPPAQGAEAAVADPALVKLAMAALLAAGKIQRQGTVISLAGRGAKVSPAEQALAGQIEQFLLGARLSPPSPAELAAQLGVPEEKVEAMLRLLEDAGSVVRLDRKVVMHASAVESAKAVALKLFGAASGFETVQFRDELGVSRKYAVPLLDYFDTIRFTVRSGSRRTPGVAAKAAMKTAGPQERGTAGP